MQNKYSRTCLKLIGIYYVSCKEFKSINCLPVNVKIEQGISSMIFKFTNGSCPYYLNKFFGFSPERSIKLKNYLKPKHPFRETNTGQTYLLVARYQSTFLKFEFTPCKAKKQQRRTELKEKKSTKRLKHSRKKYKKIKACM